MKTISLTSLLIWLLLALTACKKEGNSENQEQGGDPNEIVIGSSKTKPGLGPNNGMPEGTDLQLPSCVKLVKRNQIHFTPDPSKLYGSSQAFYVALSVVNTCCNKPVEVALPPGMMITSDGPETQNGLLIENVYFTVPPTNCNGAPDTTTIFLAVNCLNKKKSPPMDDRKNQDYNLGYHYQIGKVTNDPNLLKLLALLSNKPGLKATDFVTNDPGASPTTDLEKMYAEIQAAIWHVTDGNGLTRAEVQKLENMLKAFR